MLLDAFTYHLSFTPDPALGEVYITALDVWHFRGGRFKGFHALNNVGQEDSNQGLGIKSEE